MFADFVLVFHNTVVELKVNRAELPHVLNVEILHLKISDLLNVVELVERQRQQELKFLHALVRESC